MFIMSEHPTKGKCGVPVYIWLPSISDVEEGCLDQAFHLSMLPFAMERIVLMPDTHQGFGMPIGGVLASKGMVIPNAVGVDIGCGIAFRRTNLKASSLDELALKTCIEKVMRAVPQGFSHHKEKQPCRVLDEFCKYHQKERKHPVLWQEIARGYNQLGTLGGGNHFIEFQEDDEGYLCFMVHSGSRNFGYQVAKYFNSIAKNNRKKWHSDVPREYDLDFLPEETEECQSYLNWMNLARDFARENRATMMNVVCRIFEKQHKVMKIQLDLDVHHNDVNREHHENQWVWVHRKGAIRAAAGELAVIPGAMGRHSYVVRGLGNKLAFESCSHGAGRVMSRKEATHQFSPDTVMRELDQRGVLLGKTRLKDIGEEAPMAYKNIEFVMSQQNDLIQIVNQLTGKAVMKG